MGYSTSYHGKVIIKPEPTASILAELKEAIANAHEESAWALEIGKDFSSIVWRGAEKTYDFEIALNAVEKYMQDKGFDFTLEGEFEYQGEESEDRGYVRKINGQFIRIPKKMEADEYKCPNCGHIFKPNN